MNKIQVLDDTALYLRVEGLITALLLPAQFTPAMAQRALIEVAGICSVLAHNLPDFDESFWQDSGMVVQADSEPYKRAGQLTKSGEKIIEAFTARFHSKVREVVRSWHTGR